MKPLGDRELRFNARWGDLSRYNSDKSHGHIFTDEYVAKMQVKQAQYNEMMRRGLDLIDDPIPDVDITWGEPPPEHNDGESIHDLVIRDMESRKQFGLNKYNTILQANNGRNALQDLYEELLDACCYVKQCLEEGL